MSQESNEWGLSVVLPVVCWQRISGTTRTVPCLLPPSSLLPLSEEAAAATNNEERNCVRIRAETAQNTARIFSMGIERVLPCKREVQRRSGKEERKERSSVYSVDFLSRSIQTD